MNTRSRLFLLFAILVPALQAHIIPPESYHPVAESYLRMNFILNLNPALWDEVRKDAVIIAAHLETLSADEAKVFRKRIKTVIDAYTDPAEGDEPGPAERKAAARKVFELTTRTVSKMVVIHLKEAEDSLSNYSEAFFQVKTARQIAESFENEVQSTDSIGFRQMGLAWLELNSALGNPGISNVSAIPPKEAVFRTHARTITDYMAANYVTYKAPEKGKLLPLPTKSSTFDPSAKTPIKLPPGNNINKQIPRPRQILGMAIRGVDEHETPLIALGDMAFDSAYIFGEPARSLQMSCNTCHNKSITNPQFFIPGLSTRKGGLDVSNSFFAGHANNGLFDPLDIPDLRGIRFTAPYGRNGRFDSLREFVRNVVVNEFNGPEPDPTLMDGLIAYMLEFEFLPNDKLNADGTLSEKASASAKRGETIFNRPYRQMGDRSCSTCHIPSNHFLDRQSHDIGTVMGFEPNSRDRALDTPTLLSAMYSAPYFHDGSQPTLRSVNEWFNKKYSLDLDTLELDDLTAYVETVADGKNAYEDTIYYLDAELEEFSFFLSAYEVLKQKNKPELMNTTFQTVANEIRNHKWELQDQTYLPVMDKLAGLMDEAYEANQKGDRMKVDKIVEEYGKLYEENADDLK